MKKGSGVLNKDSRSLFSAHTAATGSPAVPQSGRTDETPSYLLIRVFAQPRFQKLLEPDTLVCPLLVEGTKVQLSVLFVVSPSAVIGHDSSDVVHCVTQIEKLIAVNTAIASANSEEQEHLIDQVTICAKDCVWWMNNR